MTVMKILSWIEPAIVSITTKSGYTIHILPTLVIAY